MSFQVAKDVAAHEIAEFMRSLNVKTGWMPHQVADVPGCPISAEYVTAALDAAVELGLVTRDRSRLGHHVYGVKG